MRATIEYREATSLNQSVQTVVDRGVNSRGAKIGLVEIAAGYEPAGSCMRYVPSGYRVTWELRDGTRGSRFYHRIEAARANYNDSLAR